MSNVTIYESRYNSFYKNKNKYKKTINESSADWRLTVVYITSSYRVMKVLTARNSDVRKIEAEVAKEMWKNAETDDFWVDDAWIDGKNVPNLDYKKLVTDDGTRLDQDRVDQILTDEEFGIKANFISTYNCEISENNLNAVYIYDIGQDLLIEGNFRSEFPANWLYDEIEKYSLPKIIEDNLPYFLEGFARIYSDIEASGHMYSDIIDNYFLYMYNSDLE